MYGKSKNPRPAQSARNYHCSGETFKDRDLKSTSPATEQFEPTTQDPIRQRARMGGVS